MTNSFSRILRVARLRPAIAAARLLALAPLLAACGGGDDGAARGVSAPEVGYVVMRQTSVPVETVLAGRTTAFQTSEVRPQVSGIIRARTFDEGAEVEAGQTLYEIDDSLYQAAADEAAANLASAEAEAVAARALADSYGELVEADAVSRQAYTDAEAEARQAEAAIEQTRAQLERARINLRYTRITAPISGRIGRSLFTEGALVTANQADPLAVIQRLDPMYVDMQQSASDLLTLRRALESGGMTPTQTEVRLQLEDGSDYEHEGVVEFADVTVNESTGTVTLRARVPNPEGLLLPGMFVRALFSQGTEENAFLAPQVSMTRDAQGGGQVWVIGEGDTAERRSVTAERVLGNDWVVTAGLAEGDRVIVDGIGRVTPGGQVRPVAADAPGAAAAAPAGPAAARSE